MSSRSFGRGPGRRDANRGRRRHQRGYGAPRWELLPASRASGVWLVGSLERSVVALAAPGVPLADEPAEALRGWRLGSWTAAMLEGGIDAVVPRVEALSLARVVDLAPPHWHGWVREVTRVHLHHLVRFAEPAVGDQIHDGRAHEANALLHRLREDARAAFPGESWHRVDCLQPFPSPAAYTSAADETGDWDDE